MSNTWTQSRDKNTINNSSDNQRDMSSQQYSSEVQIYSEESSTDKLTRKAKDNPFFPIAMTGFTCAVLYGAYRFKHRGDMPISLYLIHLRVGAQGVAVGSLTLGMVYMLGKRLYNNYYNIPNDQKN